MYIYIKACGDFWASPPCPIEPPQHSAGLLRWQKEPKCQKRDRGRGVGKNIGECVFLYVCFVGVCVRVQTLGNLMWGSICVWGGEEVRISECLFNLIWAHPCRGAGEPCREAIVICTNYTLVRGGDRRRRIYGRVFGIQMIYNRRRRTDKNF